MQSMLVSQLPLSQRIPTLASAIRSLRDHKKQLDKEEQECLEQLRQAEQELKAHPAGSEGAEPSGLLSEPAREDAAPEEPEPAATPKVKVRK